MLALTQPFMLPPPNQKVTPSLEKEMTQPPKVKQSSRRKEKIVSLKQLKMNLRKKEIIHQMLTLAQPILSPNQKNAQLAQNYPKTPTTLSRNARKLKTMRNHKVILQSKNRNQPKTMSKSLNVILQSKNRKQPKTIRKLLNHNVKLNYKNLK